MRRLAKQQPTLVAAEIDHEHARELEAIGQLLDELPQAVQAVHADLIRDLKDPEKGRDGMTAEQVLRVLVLKQMKGFSYDQLSFELSASLCYQRLCRFGMYDPVPKKSSLQRDCKRVRPETLESINRSVLELAGERGVEDGARVRVDCTVEETNIHSPTDSSLLFGRAIPPTRPKKIRVSDNSQFAISPCSPAPRLQQT